MASRALALRTLRRALEIVEGDERKLARRLQVPSLELHGFLMGQDQPPTPVFLAAVDIVVEGAARPRGSAAAGGAVAPLHVVEDKLDRAQENGAGRSLRAG